METIDPEYVVEEAPTATLESISTRIMSRTLTCDGAFFYWWAVGEDPSLITVTSGVFGSLNGFTRSDPETFAMTLARDLMQHPRKTTTSLEKPGWVKKGGIGNAEGDTSDVRRVAVFQCTKRGGALQKL